MIYAPVIIPTLNRYEHFRKCLESLEVCTGAEHTDVYIALDYPPSEKYVDGWKKNGIFLQEKERNNKFHSFTVYRRETNYFFSGKGNGQTAIDDLPSGIDRYIFSEDDNVFSPNFLEYINKGLEKYKDNPAVLAICGYSHPYNFKFADNNYFFHQIDFSAWGYGTWIIKDNSARYEILNNHFFRKTFNLKNLKKISKTGENHICSYIYCSMQPSMREARYTDTQLSSYMVIKNMFVVMPAISKVRNMGWDASGTSFMKNGVPKDKLDIAKRHAHQQIDEKSTFEYEGNPMSFFKENNSIAVQESDGRISKFALIKKLSWIIPKMIAKNIVWTLLGRK